MQGKKVPKQPRVFFSVTLAFPYIQCTIWDMFMYRGKVKKGASRGRVLGFPTANIPLHKKIPEGIYASEVIVAGKKHHAATFVGKAETFSEKEYKSESFLLDFSGDLYDQWITVCLLKKLRDNKKFNSSEELIEQMGKDILATREFFS